MLRPGQIVSCETGSLSPLYIGLQYEPKVLTALFETIIRFTYMEETRQKLVNRIVDKQLKTYVKDFLEFNSDFEVLLKKRKAAKENKLKGRELLHEIEGFSDRVRQRTASFTFVMLLVKQIVEDQKNNWGNGGFREPRAFRPIPIAYYHVLGKSRAVHGILRTESDGEYGSHSYRYFEKITPSEPYYVIAPARIIHTSIEANNKERYEEQWSLRAHKHDTHNRQTLALLRLAKEPNYSWEQGWLDFQIATLCSGTFLVTESQVRVKQ